jgi:uncharacterized protein YbjT (DUF2867 family)
VSTHLVIGGRGRTGRGIVRGLLDAGSEVAVGSRSGDGAGPGVPGVAVDVAAADWPTVLDGVRGVAVSVEPPYDAAGAERVMHEGIAALARAAAAAQVRVVLVSQIYITRPEAYPAMAAVTRARGRGEQALRESGAGYAVVRPGWLTDEPLSGVRLEQGDTGDGRVSRTAVAEACTRLLLAEDTPPATFEIFDAPGPPDVDWPGLLAGLVPDPR